MDSNSDQVVADVTAFVLYMEITGLSSALMKGLMQIPANPRPTSVVTFVANTMEDRSTPVPTYTQIDQFFADSDGFMEYVKTTELPRALTRVFATLWSAEEKPEDPVAFCAQMMRDSVRFTWSVQAFQQIPDHS